MTRWSWPPEMSLPARSHMVIDTTPFLWPRKMRVPETDGRSREVAHKWREGNEGARREGEGNEGARGEGDGKRSP